MAQNEVIKREHIMLGLSAADKEECLRAIAQKAVELGLCTDAQAAYEGFMFRESQGATGLEDGFAIPHTRCDAVVKSGVIFAKTQKPVEWESMDDQPVEVMRALIVPKDGSNEHIRLLAALSRMLIKKDFREALKGSSSEEEIFELLSGVMNEK